MAATTTIAAPVRQDTPPVAIEDDANPLVRLLGRRLQEAACAGHAQEVFGQAMGTVAVRSHDTPQVATVALVGGTVEVFAGVPAEPGATVVVNLNARFAQVQEPLGDRALAAAVLRALTPPVPHWRDAAARFWEATRHIPGMPDVLDVHAVVPDGSERARFGEGTTSYGITGPADLLAGVFCGADDFLVSLAAGVQVQGTLSQLSVMTAASWKVRLMSEATSARKAVRLEATNHEGSLLGKNVSPAKFEAGKETGFAFADILFAIDLNNEIVLGDAFPQWRGNLYDIQMIPDMATLVEWKPGLDAVIGDYWLKDGSPVPICPRNLVRKLVGRLADLGYDATAAVEIEATLFEESVQEARARGYRDLTPLGGSTGATYHLARSSDWIAYMEAVVERLDQVGINWEAWTDEAAPGQTELNLAPTDPVRLADGWARTRQVMREVAFEQGHTVSFMAKPTAGFGQGAHINISLQSDGANRFFAENGPTDLMRHAVGGLLATMAGATSIVMPQITSYRRLVDLTGPPTTISWGVNNKTAAVRAITGHPRYSRLEYRLPGADVNPYLALAGVLAGLLAGSEQKIEPPAEVAEMAWCLPDDCGVERIPDTMSKAGAALAADPLLRAYLGDEFVDFWVASRRWEWMEFHTKGGDPFAELSAWESQRYFEFP